MSDKQFVFYAALGLVIVDLVVSMWLWNFYPANDGRVGSGLIWFLGAGFVLLTIPIILLCTFSLVFWDQHYGNNQGKSSKLKPLGEKREWRILWKILDEIFD